MKHLVTIASLSLVLPMCLTSATAAAHGVSSGVREVLAGESGAASLLMLTRGAAARHDGGWRFVCPERWGGAEAPLSAPGPSGSGWVLGEAGVALVSGVDLEPGPETPTSSARMLAVDPEALDTVHLLRDQGDGNAEIWTVGPAGVSSVEQEPTVWHALAVGGGGRTLASVQLGALVAREDSADERVWVLEGLVGVTALFRLEGRTFAHLTFVDRRALVEIHDEVETWITSTGAISGPVLHEGQLLAAADGELLRLGDDGVERLNELGVALGVHRLGGATYVSTNRHLLPLSPDLDVGAPVFNVATLERPSLDGLESDDQRSCEALWTDLVVDWSLAPGSQRDPPAPGVGPQETYTSAGLGCDIPPTHPSGASLLGLGLLLLALVAIHTLR